MAFITDIDRYKKRTIARDLIIGLTIAVSFAVGVHITTYYLYSTITSERMLNNRAASISNELTEVLSISLWNLSKNVIHQISKAYLKSAYLEGMRVEDDHGHVMFEKIPEKDGNFIVRENEIYWHGTNVGTIKMWFTRKDIENIQKAMIGTMLIIGLSAIFIIIIGTHFIMKYLLSKPMDQLIQGIRTIADGDYKSTLPSVPQDDINSIIAEANMMAQHISNRNDQLQEEVNKRKTAENELRQLNKTLELRIEQLIEAEKALAESEQKYRSIFENALEGIFQTTPGGAFINANSSMARILGYDSPEELKRKVTDIGSQQYVNPRQRDEYLRILEKQDSISNYECQLYRKDGSIIWAILQVRAFRDENGMLTHMEGVLQDISERKHAEAELRESEKKYRELYEGSRDGYMMMNINGCFLECNSSFCEMLGYTLEELRQLTYSDITPEKWFKQEMELLKKQTIERGYTDVYEKEYVRKDGLIFPVEMRVYSIRNRGGNHSGYWGFVRDITEKKTLQADAMRNARLASLGELAAGVAHEINNPINGIINYAQILINRSSKQLKETELPQKIIKEGERIERIVRNLLSFARERKEKKTSVYIQNIIAESMDFTQSMLRKDHIRVKFDIPADLPGIKANAQQIQQVFLNIISNARYALNQKYVEKDNNKILSIKSQVININGAVEIRTTFVDNGIGISSNILDRICDPFFSTKPPDKGSGLGLSISHGIIKDHDGKLWLESQEGEYTKVTIELPI